MKTHATPKRSDKKTNKLTLSRDTLAHLVTKTGVKGGARNTQPSQCPVCYR